MPRHTSEFYFFCAPDFEFFQITINHWKILTGESLNPSQYLFSDFCYCGHVLIVFLYRKTQMYMIYRRFQLTGLGINAFMAYSSV